MATNLVNSGVRGKLHRLQSGIRARLAGEGLAWMLLAMVAAIFVTLGLDYLLALPRLVRAMFGLLALGGIAYVVVRFMVVPLLVPLDNENLALLVERRYGQLKDRLISAIQFSKMPTLEAAFGSPAMIERMACEANDLAERFDFQEVIERRNMWRSLGLAASGLMILAGFTIWQPGTMALWFQRNVLFQDIAWPQNTKLKVPLQNFSVLRGEDLTIERKVIRDGKEVSIYIEAEMKGGNTPPAQIIVHSKYPSVSEETQTKINETSPGSGVYTMKYVAVNESFSFYVTGGDDRTDKENRHLVTVIDPPSLNTITFFVDYDAYINKPRDSFEGSRGGLSARPGSKITIKAEANKDIRFFEMFYNGKSMSKVTPEQTVVNGQPQLRKLTGSFIIDNENKPSIGSLGIALHDTAGFTNLRGGKYGQTYLVQIQPDLAPSVDFKTQGIGNRVSMKATIPMLITVKDDTGLAKINAAASGVRGVTQVPATQPTTAPAATQPASAPAPIGKPEIVGPAPELAVGDKDYNNGRPGNVFVKIKDMHLLPGDVVTVWVEAKDNMPETFFTKDDKGKTERGPNKAKSAELSFAVVRDSDLMEEFIARRRSVQLDFMQAIKNHSEGRMKIASAGGAVVDQVTSAALQILGDAAGTETSISSDSAKAFDTLKAVMDEQTNNDVGTPEDRAKDRTDMLDGLTLVRAELAKEITAINAARKESDAAKFKEQAKAIVEMQLATEALMQKVCDAIAKGTDRDEIINRMQVIINWVEIEHGTIQGIVNRETENKLAPLAPTTTSKPTEKEEKPKQP